MAADFKFLNQNFEGNQRSVRSAVVALTHAFGTSINEKRNYSKEVHYFEMKRILRIRGEFNY